MTNETYLCPITGRRKLLSSRRYEEGKAFVLHITATALMESDGLSKREATEAAQAEWNESINRMSSRALFQLPRQEDGTFVDLLGED